MDGKSYSGVYMDSLLSDIDRRSFSSCIGRTGIGLIACSIISKSAFGSDDRTQFFTWGGYDSSELYEDYVNQFGEMPSLSFFEDQTEAFHKLRAGYSPDVVSLCVEEIGRWRDSDMLAPIDTGRLKNWSDVIESLKSTGEATTDGEQWMIPFEWGLYSIAYRNDLIVVDDPSWDMLWRSEFAGRVPELTGSNALSIAALLVDPDGYRKGHVDLKAVENVLLDHQSLSNSEIRSDDFSKISDSLRSGKIIMAPMWSNQYFELLAQDIPLNFLKPKEGSLYWMCGIVLASQSDRRDSEEVYGLIDSLISPGAGRYIVREFGYGHANRRTFEEFSEEDLHIRGLSHNPEDLINTSVTFVDVCKQEGACTLDQCKNKPPCI